MKINLFEINKKEAKNIETYLEKNNVNNETFNNIMMCLDTSFSVENCSRLASHLICLNKDSYTQQSMRYVPLKNNYILPPLISEERAKEFKEVVDDLFSLYNEMTILKDSKQKGRKKEYKHGIPIEDGRYILPLCSPTNILITMSGNKIRNFFHDLLYHPYPETIDIALKFVQGFSEFPNIQSAIFKDKKLILDKEQLYDFHKQKFLTNGLQNIFDEKRAAIGALTSTNEKPPSKLKPYESIIKATMDKGHKSIAEHVRTLYLTKQSLVTFHQFERHRIAENYLEPFEKIPIDREIIIPPSIERNHLFKEKYLENSFKAKRLRQKLIDDENQYSASYLLLNGDWVNVITSSNARNDLTIFEERLCNNAQWEIRNLAKDLLDKTRTKAPNVYDKAGPACTKGDCPEKEYSCHSETAMRKKYGDFR